MSEAPQPYSGQPQQPPQVWQAPPQPLPKKRRVWLWVVGGLLLFSVLVCGGCVALVGMGANEVDKAANEEHTVVYEVVGKGVASSITYSATDSGGTEQESNAKLPWKKETKSKGLWNAYSLIAQAEGDGEISCKITIDGQLVTEKTSKGEFAVVTCEASSDDIEA